jgi:hypothetical protein
MLHGRHLTSIEMQREMARLQLELHEKDRELDLYLAVAANLADQAQAPPTSQDSGADERQGRGSEERLAREVYVLRERLNRLQLQSHQSQTLALSPPPPMHQPRQTHLQGVLAEINFAFDLLDADGSGSIGRWEILKGLMDHAEVRGLLRLGAVANQSDFDTLVKAMGKEGEAVSRTEFERFFMLRELQQVGEAGSEKGGATAQADAPKARETANSGRSATGTERSLPPTTPVSLHHRAAAMAAMSQLPPLHSPAGYAGYPGGYPPLHDYHGQYGAQPTPYYPPPHHGPTASYYSKGSVPPVGGGYAGLGPLGESGYPRTISTGYHR